MQSTPTRAGQALRGLTEWVATSVLRASPGTSHGECQLSLSSHTSGTAMQFIVQPEVFARFPGLMLAVAVAHDIDNARELSVVERGWRAAWQGASAAELPGA